MIYLQLFLSFLQVGMFSFGGGYAALPLIQGQVVKVHSWLSMSEFTDLITISQMTPGPIAVNSATFVGEKDCRYTRSALRNSRVHIAVLYYCNGNCKDLSKMAEYGVISGGVRLFAPSGCCIDSIGRNINSHYGILGK